MSTARLIATKIILAVHSGHSLTEQLATCLPQIKDERDQTFTQALCFGVCRFYPWLNELVNLLIKKPLRTKDYDIHCVLMISLYQLFAMRTPAYAVIAEAMRNSTQLKKSWARALINAVLQEYLRNRSQLEHRLTQDPSAHYAHPTWIIEKLQHDWPAHWTAILTANNAHPPFMLRVNQQLITRAAYHDRLHAAKLNAQIIPHTLGGIKLIDPIKIEHVPGFQHGLVSVQDGAAQLAAPLLDLKPGLRILDGCAAPGGKLAHIAEITPEAKTIIGLDNNSARLNKIASTLQRLQLKASYLHADATAINQWWDGVQFDRILLDAPCSGSGVIRRHPDIKLLRRPTDIKQLADQQLKLLHALWPTLAPHGLLLYCTCSVFKQENSEVITQFLLTQPDSQLCKLNLAWGIKCTAGQQILPGMDDMDGFYFALLRKS